MERVSPFRFPGIVAQKELLREVNDRRRKAGLLRVEAPPWRGEKTRGVKGNILAACMSRTVLAVPVLVAAARIGKE